MYVLFSVVTNSICMVQREEFNFDIIISVKIPSMFIMCGMCVMSLIY